MRLYITILAILAATMLQAQKMQDSLQFKSPQRLQVSATIGFRFSMTSGQLKSHLTRNGYSDNALALGLILWFRSKEYPISIGIPFFADISIDYFLNKKVAFGLTSG